MVKALHGAGIEVVLDVVLTIRLRVIIGDLLSFRGFKNDAYHILDWWRFANYNGTGNTLNANHPIVEAYQACRGRTAVMASRLSIVSGSSRANRVRTRFKKWRSNQQLCTGIRAGGSTGSSDINDELGHFLISWKHVRIFCE
jgi:hypothetical protein